ncbi:MAG: dihydrodipicolinate synthase family protein, partial [Candidatus Omnitrophota bacterium]
MFKGSYVALVTPFKDGKVDEKRFRELVEFQIDKGTDGIVPCGCTGEAATMNMTE